MSLKQGALLLAAVVVIATAASYVVSRQLLPGPAPADPPPEITGRDPVSAVYLYFGDPQTEYLSAETRSLSHRAGPSALGRAIVEALIAGPATDRIQTLPEQTVLSAFYVTDDATAYVDLSKAVADEHPGGAHSELMTVFSVVNSLALNIPEIQRVKILIAGTDAPSLAGHIDLRSPLTANMLIVR